MDFREVIASAPWQEACPLRLGVGPEPDRAEKTVLQGEKMKRSGMSLLEILIVLSIMAVLIAIIAPRILGSQKKADIKATKLQISNIEEALKLYAADNRTFPNTEEGIAALFEAPADEKRAKNWEGPYFDGDGVQIRVPLNPWLAGFSRHLVFRT
jgi:general secretion pathway protein G